MLIVFIDEFQRLPVRIDCDSDYAMRVKPCPFFRRQDDLRSPTLGFLIGTKVTAHKGATKRAERNRDVRSDVHTDPFTSDDSGYLL